MVAKSLFVSVLLVAASNCAGFAVNGDALNEWPIIGVFTQPSTSTAGTCGGNCLYLAASYVKYIEAAGARVVPVNYYANTTELDAIFESVNGFFFPGGASSFPTSAQYIYDRVVKANDAGDFMPLWGTCMGFQWLLLAQSRDSSILDPPKGQMDSYNYSIPLDLTSDASTSNYISSAPAKVVKILTTENVTMNNHHYGIYPSHFSSTSSLSSFFSMISTNKDRQGVEFVSMIEAFDYPIIGSQWHPEKNDFEWGKTNGIPNEAINHSPAAMLVAQYSADFFVQLARRNTHHFADSDLEFKALMDNYTPTKNAHDSSFVQSYYLSKSFVTI